MSAPSWSEVDERNQSRETTYQQTETDASRDKPSGDKPSGDKRMDTHTAADDHTDDHTGDPFDPFRCRDCGELIGVYEPLAVADEQGIRISSRAAEPDLGARGVYFHRDCFESDEAGAKTTRRRSAWRRASGAGPSA